MHAWSPGLGPGSGLLSFLPELPDQMKAVLLRRYASAHPRKLLLDEGKRD
jgi:hypothetical protein